LLAAVFAVAVVGSALAAAGGGGNTVTKTDNFHGDNPSTGINPCTANTIDLDQTSNIVQYVTFFPGGYEVWGDQNADSTRLTQISPRRRASTTACVRLVTWSFS
jgi:hypothetical protein